MNNRIAKTAKTKGITIVQISKATGLSRAYIYNVISDKCQPSLQNSRKIARSLDSTLEYIFPE